MRFVGTQHCRNVQKGTINPRNTCDPRNLSSSSLQTSEIASNFPQSHPKARKTRRLPVENLWKTMRLHGKTRLALGEKLGKCCG